MKDLLIRFFIDGGEDEFKIREIILEELLKLN